MGIGSSSYKMVAGRNLDWVADPSSKIFPIKHDAFNHVLGLGKGKFGMVFLAKQSMRDSNLHVAIKYVPKQTIFDFQSGSKMQQEIQALQKCDHPFITHCFGGFETTHCIALVLEFAYGGELYHRLQQVHRMGETEAKFYFCELASALHYLHDELSIAYRDLKPENVLIDKEGHVRLCDFGFATEITAGPDGGAAPLQDGCGTVMYMAPELVGKSQKTSHSFPVDWWALGCVLAELVTGDAPFGSSENMSKFEIFNRISESPPSLPLFMGMRLKTLLRGLLDKSDSSRYSFEQVAKSSWLKEVNWDDLENRRIRPPWIPYADSITPAAPNFISWDSLALPTGNIGSSALAYCKDIKLPGPRSSSLVFGKKSNGSSPKGAAAAAGLNKPGTTGRLPRQNSRKVGPADGEVGAGAGMVLDSPATEKARKRPDSIMVARERSKVQMSGEAFGEATAGKVADSVKLQKERSKARINTAGDSSPSAPVSSKTMTKTQDSVKLQRERSKAAMKREHSTIQE